MAIEREFEGILQKHGVTISELLKFPKFVQIETVSSCNARCVMCPVEDWKRSTKLMSDKVWNSIVDQLRPYASWLAMVCPQLQGEPLIDKKLETRIAQLKSIGIRNVIINCNASLMSPGRAKSLLESGLDEITFSVDGVTKETFEKIRLRLDYNECIENILNFIKVRDEIAPHARVRIRMTVSETNAHEYNDFMSFWALHLGPQDNAYGKLIHNWANWLDDFNLPQQSRDELNARPCQSLWTSLVILSDGRVPLCCSDFNAEAEIGDVLTSSIEEIWQGRKLARVREGHSRSGRSSTKMCKDCNVWDETSNIEGQIRRKRELVAAE